MKTPRGPIGDPTTDPRCPECREIKCVCYPTCPKCGKVCEEQASGDSSTLTAVVCLFCPYCEWHSEPWEEDDKP